MKKKLLSKIPFYVLNTHLYTDYIEYFGKKRVVSIPFWSVDENGKKGKMMRNCTLDYKINEIIKFVKYHLLGYQKYQRLNQQDFKAHEMHLGFSLEESKRCKENKHKMFVNKFPLVEMNLTRADNYKHILQVLVNNLFLHFLKDNHPDNYSSIIEFDEMLEREQPNTKIRSKLYISKSRKRIRNLKQEDCCDKESFQYKNKSIWNGF